jgi:hypothetical protein
MGSEKASWGRLRADFAGRRDIAGKAAQSLNGVGKSLMGWAQSLMEQAFRVVWMVT